MDSMLQPLPWLLSAALAGAGTAHAATPEGTATPEATEAAPDGGSAAPEDEGGAAPSTAATEPAATFEADPPATASEPPASDPAPAATAQQATATEPAPAPRPPRTYPRLVIAAGPIAGPHARGNEQCDPEQARCETKGAFIGMGAQVELRARLWKLVYAHARGLAVGNVSPHDRVHRGLWGAGAGVGLQGRRAFGRAEYLWVSTFGDNHFEPPFYEGEVATDEWGHHAGMLSVGFRQPLPHRLAVELWGGLVIGPRSVRRVPDLVPDERVLTTFLVGLDVSWDAIPP
jgi:hypothetical protein